MFERFGTSCLLRSIAPTVRAPKMVIFYIRGSFAPGSFRWKSPNIGHVNKEIHGLQGDRNFRPAIVLAMD